MAPVSRMQIMVGRTLGGATVSVIQGTLVFLICILFGFRPHSWLAVPGAFLFIFLVAMVFSALGTAIGVTVPALHFTEAPVRPTVGVTPDGNGPMLSLVGTW